MLMSPVFLFLTQHLLNFEHKLSDRRQVQTICLLAILCRKEYFYCVHLKGIFWHSLIFNFFLYGESLFQYKSVTQKKKKSC